MQLILGSQDTMGTHLNFEDMLESHHVMVDSCTRTNLSVDKLLRYMYHILALHLSFLLLH